MYVTVSRRGTLSNFVGSFVLTIRTFLENNQNELFSEIFKAPFFHAQVTYLLKGRNPKSNGINKLIGLQMFFFFFVKRFNLSHSIFHIDVEPAERFNIFTFTYSR